MSPIKEPRFFALDDQGWYPDLGPEAPFKLIQDLVNDSVRNWSDYLNLFTNAKYHQITGEASPLYLFTERSPEKIKQALPNVKMVAILRQPVELAFSAFHMNRRNGYEAESIFNHALPLNKSSEKMGWRWKLYIEQALHSRNLKRFLTQFHPDQIKVFLYDYFVHDPYAVISSICQYIGVNTDISIDCSLQHNVGYETRFPPTFRRLIKQILPDKMAMPLKTVFQRWDRRKVSLSQKLRSQYLAFFREDILELQDLLKRDLTNWLR